MSSILDRGNVFAFFLLFFGEPHRNKSPSLRAEKTVVTEASRSQKQNTHTSNRTQLFREERESVGVNMLPSTSARSLWVFGTMLKGTSAVL